MTVRSIVLWPAEALSKKAAPVVQADTTEELSQLAEDLVDTLNACSALGIAAPQIGVSKRMIVVLDAKGEPMVLVNPELLPNDSPHAMRVERCLSLPGVKSTVRRQTRVTVRAHDANWHLVEFVADQHTACAIQHEIDHLDGVVMVDHESQLKKGLARQRLAKFKRQVERNGAES